MRRVDFFVSSPGHHVDTALPVAERLAREGAARCRFVSLCELRGLPSPGPRLEAAGFATVAVVGARVRPSPASGRQATGRVRRLARAALRRAAWRLLLGRRLARILDPPPDLVVVPNDGAFPYDRIAALLRSRRVPFLLLQEGVRFDYPGATDPGYHRQGRGGASAIAAWGESSAEYFRRRGVPDERIHLVGCPRFDALLATDWAAAGADAARRLGLGGRVLLLVTNPIDDLGLTSTAEKLALVRRFAAGLGPLFEDPELTLVVKIHRRESAADYRAALAGAAPEGRLRVVGDEPLYPLLGAAAAVVVIASTVGLEALLLGRPLGVLEVPRVGYVHDYVGSGAAAALAPGDGLADSVGALLERPAARRREVEDYLSHTLAVRRGATRRVAELVAGLAAEAGPRRADPDRGRELSDPGAAAPDPRTPLEPGPRRRAAARDRERLGAARRGRLRGGVEVALRVAIERFLSNACDPLVARLRPARPEPGSLTILAFHSVTPAPRFKIDVTPGFLEEVLSRVAGGSQQVVPLADAVRRLVAGDLDSELLSLTFDDGYPDFLEHAAPLLARYRLPATVAVVPGYVESGEEFPFASGRGRRSLGWRELAGLLERYGDLVTLANHSQSHRDLTSLPLEEVAAELDEAQAALRDRLGIEPEVFFYPFGFDDEATAELVGRRFAAGLTGRWGTNRRGADRRRLARITLMGCDGPATRRLKIAGRATAYQVARDLVSPLVRRRRRR